MMPVFELSTMVLKLDAKMHSKCNIMSYGRDGRTGIHFESVSNIVRLGCYVEAVVVSCLPTYFMCEYFLVVLSSIVVT